MSAGTVARNSFFVLIARGVDTLGAMLLIWLSAQYMLRNFGIDINGQYAFLVTLIGLIFTLANFGLAQIIIRDVAQDKSLAPSYLKSALVLRFVLSLICALVVIAVAIVYPITRDMRIGILIAVLAEIGNTISWNYINMFNAFERMDFEAVSSIIFRLVTIILTLAVIHFKLHWTYLFVAITFGSFFRMLYVIWQCRTIVTPADDHSTTHIKAIFKEAVPIGVALLLTAGYLRIDVLLLQRITLNYSEVAYFWYPYQVLLQLNILPLALTTALFPVMARAAKKSADANNENEMESLFVRTLKFYLILSLPMMIFGFLYATPIMTTLFTEKMARAGLCLQILIWSTFFVFIELLMSHSLIATGRQKALYFANGTCLVVNFTMDYILIKYFHLGAIGASFGTLSAYFALFSVLLYFMSDTVSVLKMLQQFPRPMIAAVLSALIFYPLRSYAWYFMIPFGCIVYVVILFAIRTFSENELSMFKKLLRPPGPVRT